MSINFCRYLFAALFGFLVGFGAQAAEKKTRTPVTQEEFAQIILGKRSPGFSCSIKRRGSRKAIERSIPAMFDKVNRAEQDFLPSLERAKASKEVFQKGVAYLKGVLQNSTASPEDRNSAVEALKQSCEDLGSCLEKMKKTEIKQTFAVGSGTLKLNFNTGDSFKKMVQELDGAITSFGANASPEVQEVVECLRRTKQKIENLS